MKLALPNLATLSRRERLLVVGSAMALSVVLLDRLVLGPWWHHMAKVRQDIRRLEASIRTDRQLLSRQPQIRLEADTYREYLREPGTKAPNLAALLREIESLGGESGVSLGEVKPSEGPANGLYREYTIAVNYRGSMEQSVHFLYLLQSSKLLFGLERVALQRSTEDPTTLNGALRLTSKVMVDEPNDATGSKASSSDKAPRQPILAAEVSCGRKGHRAPSRTILASEVLVCGRRTRRADERPERLGQPRVGG